jgi:hypothetical protein
MVTIHNIDQRTTEWLEARVGKFTGSNAHKLLKYGRTDKARVEANPSFTGNYWTKRGQDLEPFAIAAYELTIASWTSFHVASIMMQVSFCVHYVAVVASLVLVKV